MLGFSQKEKNKALYEAIRNGDTDKVRKALKSGADPNNRDDTLPLIQALGNGNETNVLLLIEAGAELYAGNGSGHLPIHLAALYGRERSLCKMMEKVPLSVRNSDHETPLFCALARGNHALASKMMKMDHALSEKTLPDGTSLLHAAIHGNAPVDLLQAIMDVLSPEEMNAYSEKHGCVLPLAVSSKKAEDTVDFLIASGKIDINGKRRWKYSGTALHAAVYNSSAPHVVESLVTAGIDLTVEDEGRTAFEYAASYGNMDALKVILKGMKEAGIKPKLDEALYYTVKNESRIDTIRFLLAEGADINYRDKNGQTLLMTAAKAGVLENVQFLMRHGQADAGLFDEKGMTAIDHAKTNEVRDFLRTCRLADTAAIAMPMRKSADNGMFVKTGDYTVDVGQGGLTMTFNFWMQHVVWRDNGNPQAPMVVQSFDDVQRKEAIEEARRALLEQGGKPPETPFRTIRKSI